MNKTKKTIICIVAVVGISVGAWIFYKKFLKKNSSDAEEVDGQKIQAQENKDIEISTYGYDDPFFVPVNPEPINQKPLLIDATKIIKDNGYISASGISTETITLTQEDVDNLVIKPFNGDVGQFITTVRWREIKEAMDHGETIKTFEFHPDTPEGYNGINGYFTSSDTIRNADGFVDVIEMEKSVISCVGEDVVYQIYQESGINNAGWVQPRYLYNSKDGYYIQITCVSSK